MTMNMCLRSAELNERQFLRHSELQEAVLSNYCFCTKTDVKIAKLHLKQTPTNFGHCRWECEQHSKRLRYKNRSNISVTVNESYRNIQTCWIHRHTGYPESKATAQLPTTVSNTTWTKQSQQTAEQQCVYEAMKNGNPSKLNFPEFAVTVATQEMKKKTNNNFWKEFSRSNIIPFWTYNCTTCPKIAT